MIAGITEYGQAIEIALIQRKKPKKWLIQELQERTGMFVDGSNLNKIMTGKIKSPKITDAIEEILGVKY